MKHWEDVHVTGSCMQNNCATVCRKQAVQVTKQRRADNSRLQAEGFEVNSLHVYETDPKDKSCKTWKHIQEVPFRV